MFCNECLRMKFARLREFNVCSLSLAWIAAVFFFSLVYSFVCYILLLCSRFKLDDASTVSQSISMIHCVAFNSWPHSCEPFLGRFAIKLLLMHLLRVKFISRIFLSAVCLFAVWQACVASFSVSFIWTFIVSFRCLLLWFPVFILFMTSSADLTH